MMADVSIIPSNYSCFHSRLRSVYVRAIGDSVNFDRYYQTLGEEKTFENIIIYLIAIPSDHLWFTKMSCKTLSTINGKGDYHIDS